MVYFPFLDDACKFTDPQESLPQVPTQQVAADNQSLNDGTNPALRSDDGADSKDSDASGEPTDEAPGDSDVPGSDIDGVDDAEPGSAATSGDRAPAPRGSTGTPTEIGGDSGVGESTGSDRASTGAGSPTGATGGGASDARATSPSTGETSQRGNRCCCKQEFQITNYLLVCSATLVPDPPFSTKTRVCNSTDS